jgi:protein TonB
VCSSDLGAALIIPIVTGHDLPEVIAASRVFFVEPAAVPAPLPPPARLPPGRRGPTPPTPDPTNGRIVAPPEIPDGIVPDIENEFGAPNGDPNGVVNGSPDGVIGTIVPGLPPAPPPVQDPIRVGGKIHEPRKLRDVLPVFPQIAIAAHIQGDVILDCVINAQGRVTEWTVVSGPQILVPSAVDALRQWVYTPTLLNGVPVPILLQVTVHYHLR